MFLGSEPECQSVPKRPPIHSNYHGGRVLGYIKNVETETYVAFVLNSLSILSRMINMYDVINWAYVYMHGVAYETPLHISM